MDTRPVSVGDGTEEGANEADGIVDFAFFEKRIVPAIMLNDEDANKEKCVDKSEGERKPNRVLYTKAHGDPQGDKRAEATEDLSNSFGRISLLILGYDGFPITEALVDVLYAMLDRSLHVKEFTMMKIQGFTRCAAQGTTLVR